MKKIDLHIHTISTTSDCIFTFSLKKLQDYIVNAKLDAIAITNHNCFDIQQFKTIMDAINIKIFPGIEIDLGKGHVLIIDEGDNLPEFSRKCEIVSKIIVSPKDNITVDQLKQIFKNLHDYLIIPHFGKNPELSSDAITNLAEFITAGEVESPKKFIRAKNDESGLVPVYFSDVRIKTDLELFPTRQTFIDCDDINLTSLKNCLNDKTKVTLSEKDGNNLFQVFDNGQKLSTGLNVVLGERSSGKSFMLNRIDKELGGAKYIKQFSLVQDDESDERKFNDFLNDQHSLITEEYLKEFKIVLNDVIDIDLESNNRRLTEYLDSLLKSATEAGTKDIFSKTTLFGEIEFRINDLGTFKTLIGAVIHLIENIAHKELIEKHLNKESLKKLAIELIEIFRKNSLLEKNKKIVNEAVREIKTGLKLKTSATQIKPMDLYKYKMEENKVKRFIQISKNLQIESIVQEENVQGFRVIANKRKFSGAGEIKKISGQITVFSDAYKKYDTPYEYLKELKKNEALLGSEYYKFFVKIEYKIINRDGFEVSGGERSEFKLLHAIKDAQNYDYLLIDEPESSFDNIFLKSEVNKIIKEISKNMPVVVVTHNSTVGASIKPDYLIYTCKNIEGGIVKYKTYSGYPVDKELLSLDGEKKHNFELTVNSLEGGDEVYTERRINYDNLKK